MFSLTVEGKFSASHMLENYTGDCYRCHGHNYLVKVEVSADKLDADGFVCDFKHLKNSLKSILSIFDHHFVVQITELNEKLFRKINEIEEELGMPGRIGKPVFVDYNPTAENMAEDICRMLGRVLSKRLKILSVEVFETPKNSAKYKGE